MFAEARYVLLGFLMYFSDGDKVYGQVERICALKGSSVDLLCPSEDANSSMIWYTVAPGHQNSTMEALNDTDGSYATYEIAAENNFTWTITNLDESDAKSYCCTEKARTQESSWSKIIELHVTDLQVKVIPATEGQTVSLMCSTSCRPTETPLVYIWYRNGQFLYDDWSPWYQELVGSDTAATYSCAVKGYEDLRAPDVSVDSVTSACFKVTYAKGRMCSHHQKSEDKPCSNTYPRELYIRTTKKSHYTTMTCDSSCPLSDTRTTYRWYWDNELNTDCESKDMVIVSSEDSVVFCAIKGHEDLLSNEVCPGKVGCQTVNYVSRRICALEGSSVNISSEVFTQPYALTKNWYKASGRGEAVKVLEVADRIAFYEDKPNHTLRINDVKQNDSAEYFLSPASSLHLDLPRMLLVVTGLKVTMTPSALVTEGQRVTLTCTTSCPLKNDTVFVWYMDGRPLSLLQNQNKHLLLDPVSLENAGNYSCVVVSSKNNVSSAEEGLTVKARDKSALIINAGKLAVLVLMLTATFVLYLWMRTRKRLTSTNKLKDKVQPSQMDSLYQSIMLRPKKPAAQAGRELQQDPTQG